MPDHELPTSEHTRAPDQPLSQPELQMLFHELNPNVTVDEPDLVTSWLVRRLRKLFGLTERDRLVYEQLQRQQALLTALYQLVLNTRGEATRAMDFLSSTNKVLSEEMIPQVNRQTNAIGSLLDRLQFYEKNITLVGRARKQYDRILARIIAERERKAAEEELRRKTLEEGIVVGDQQPEDDGQLSLVVEDELSDVSLGDIPLQGRSNGEAPPDGMATTDGEEEPHGHNAD